MSLCVIFMILVSLENVKKCVLGGCTITSKTKINVVWNFFLTPLVSSGPLRSKKFQTTLILAFEANSAVLCTMENRYQILFWIFALFHVKVKIIWVLTLGKNAPRSLNMLIFHLKNIQPPMDLQMSPFFCNTYICYSWKSDEKAIWYDLN